jgi:predicted esterase
MVIRKKSSVAFHKNAHNLFTIFFIYFRLNYYVRIMLQSKNIPTTKTARYYTLGSVNSQTRNIWLVLHGYAMNAEEFISQFQSFADAGDYVIAPEALSRFYTKGFFGTVGASWMTKEDRLNDTDYLNRLYESEIKPYIAADRNIHLLGFSQGSTTLFRYISFAPNHFDHIWACAGDIPVDLNWENLSRLLVHGKLHIHAGKNDELISTDRINEVLQRLQQRNISYDLHEFSGGHEIDFSHLQQYR